MEQDSSIMDLQVLHAYFPLNALTRNELAMLAGQISLSRAKKGKVLVQCGSSDQKSLFLLNGKLELEADDGRTHVIEHGTPRAFQPISHLDPHRYTVKCMTPVEFVRVENRIIDNLLEEQIRFGEKVDDLYISEAVMNNRLFQDLYEDLVEDKLTVPTLPKVAMQIRDLMNDDIDIRKLEVILHTDPALALLILKVANSALYRSDSPIKTLDHAILKLGINMVRNLVFAFSMHDLFKSEYDYINKRLKKLWTHSVEVAAVCFVLARNLKEFDPEYALLLGLLHDIGTLPVLAYAERYRDIAESPQKIDQSIDQLHCQLGGVILSEWHFAEEFVSVAKEADSWLRDSNSNADYCDLVLVAQLHSFIGKSREYISLISGNSHLPMLADTPAFRNLGLELNGPEQCISILADANRQLAEAKQILLM